ncbi:phage tail assembly chaperone [Pseudomonas mosselii]|uniref:phage tail assembly chaperone n=1 Tax=Pseudomonas mosselii TaxID=78327 RepID=UPI000D80C130|nr:phage tail assembly chaperone [Pseudomonas mosselii]PYC19073.1 hypothetical protein DMX06_16350 [Pseudomonas mosselii]
MKYLNIAGGEVACVFLCPQSAEYWSEVVEVEDDDPRYLAFVDQWQPAARRDERVWRDAELVEIAWLRDRHRDQVEIGIDPTLTGEQYKSLMMYLQSLRDWPQSSDYPDASHRPMAPAFLELQGRPA